MAFTIQPPIKGHTRPESSSQHLQEGGLMIMPPPHTLQVPQLVEPSGMPHVSSLPGGRSADALSHSSSSTPVPGISTFLPVNSIGFNSTTQPQAPSMTTRLNTIPHENPSASDDQCNSRGPPTPLPPKKKNQRKEKAIFQYR